MKRSGFRRRPGKKYKRLRPKPTEWDLWRPELKLQFEAAGFTRCEICLEGCWRNDALGFAHVDKRDQLQGIELYVAVVLACNPCHDIVEAWGRERMRPFIQAIIDRRGWMPRPPGEENDGLCKQPQSVSLRRLLPEGTVAWRAHTAAGKQPSVSDPCGEHSPNSHPDEGVLQNLQQGFRHGTEEIDHAQTQAPEHKRTENTVAPRAPGYLDDIPF